jgi:hypothetical protein
MKQMARGLVFLFAVVAISVSYGAQPGRGVGGVNVVVKQRPSDRAITDGRGNFALEALAAGSYILTFRARKADDDHSSTSDRVVVATLYSIKIEGTKRPVVKNGLTSNDLLAGVEVQVDLAAGARIRGQVAAAATKKMVWIPREPGSNLPGRWVAEDSPEARAARHYNSHAVRVEGVREIQR